MQLAGSSRAWWAINCLPAGIVDYISVVDNRGPHILNFLSKNEKLTKSTPNKPNEAQYITAAAHSLQLNTTETSQNSPKLSHSFNDHKIFIYASDLSYYTKSQFICKIVNSLVTRPDYNHVRYLTNCWRRLLHGELN